MDAINKENRMTMGKALIYYIAALAALVGFWWLVYGLVSLGIIGAKAKWPLIPMILLYFALGVYLGKAVLNKLIEWHPLYNTVSNVAGAKVKQIVFWPISYPVLLVSLLASEKL